MTGVCFPTKKTGERLLSIFLCFQILVTPIRMQCRESPATDDDNKISHCWIKYLSTMGKGTATACQCWAFMCLCVLCHKHWHQVFSRCRFPAEMSWNSGNCAWVKQFWVTAQGWCGNVTANMISTKGLTSALLLFPGWPFLRPLIFFGLCSRQYPFYLFLLHLRTVAYFYKQWWLGPVKALRGRKGAVKRWSQGEYSLWRTAPTGAVKRWSQTSQHGRKKRPPSSTCRARSATQQWGEVGMDTQTNVCG